MHDILNGPGLHIYERTDYGIKPLCSLLYVTKDTCKKYVQRTAREMPCAVEWLFRSPTGDIITWNR